MTRAGVLLPLAGVLLFGGCDDRIVIPTQPSPASAALAATGPMLVINEVMADPDAVSDDRGEWFEVYNPGTTGVDLKGWALASNNDAAHTVGSSVVVPAGGYSVLGRNGSKSRNGGVVVHYVYGTSLTLANASDWLVLRDATGATVDSVAWGSSMPTGATRGVSDPSADNTDARGVNWHTATSIFGKGDKGTPGTQNDGYIAPAGEITTVTVSPATASIAVAATQAFSASAADANGTIVTTTYAWTSSNIAVATVDANGTASAVAEGSATIRATAPNGIYGEAALTVTTSSGGGGSASEVIVKVLDIGQGDATYIQNGTSRVFIDGGPDTTAFRQHLDALSLRGGTVDVVVISHAHFDHYSGLRELFKTSNNIQLRYLFENRDAGTAVTLGQLRDSINARVSRGELIVRDTDDPCGDGRAVCTVSLNGGAKLHVMKPNPAGSTPNNRSTPVKLVGPDSTSFSMWFAGDAEHEAQDWFDTGAEYDLFPGMRVNVLKANHHGSCNGVKSRFVDLVNPDWVTFSLSATNTYGHVHTQTKDLFTRYGKPWYRTDRNGTVTFRSPGTAGGGYTVTVEKGGASESGSPDRASSQDACQSL
ncbi:MAG: lamin tail domain-containing protein [Gemmatimonadota bacterium]|nr:lamin tail domain-containing protein [Gemmatimonadota bacterium]